MKTCICLKEVLFRSNEFKVNHKYQYRLDKYVLNQHKKYMTVVSDIKTPFIFEEYEFYQYFVDLQEYRQKLLNSIL